MVKKKIKKINFKRDKTIYKKGKKNNLKEIATILTYIAIVMLLFQGIYALISMDKLVEQLNSQSLQKLEAQGMTTEIMKDILTGFAIAWIVLAIALFVVNHFVSKRKIGWGWLLALSILVIFTGRIEVSLMGIISSILYSKSK